MQSLAKMKTFANRSMQSKYAVTHFYEKFKRDSHRGCEFSNWNEVKTASQCNSMLGANSECFGNAFSTTFCK